MVPDRMTSPGARCGAGARADAQAWAGAKARTYLDDELAAARDVVDVPTGGYL